MGILDKVRNIWFTPNIVIVDSKDKNIVEKAAIRNSIFETIELFL